MLLLALRWNLLFLFGRWRSFRHGRSSCCRRLSTAHEQHNCVSKTPRIVFVLSRQQQTFHQALHPKIQNPIWNSLSCHHCTNLKFCLDQSEESISYPIRSLRFFNGMCARAGHLIWEWEGFRAPQWGSRSGHETFWFVVLPSKTITVASPSINKGFRHKN